MMSHHSNPNPQPQSSSSDNSQTKGNHTNCDNEHQQQIDNSAKLLEKIANLYAERLLSDIIIEVKGKQYAAHRLILCASSDVFQVMLMNPNWTESQEKIIVLQEEDACAKVFPEFLKYLYTGIIHINHNLVLPLVALADKYNIRDLLTLCVEYMNQHIVSATKHSQLVSWLQYTLNCGHDAVTNSCINFVAWNFESVAKMNDFYNLESDILITFLRKSDLVVTDEFTLFQITSKWLEAQEEKIKVLGDEFYDSMVVLVLSYIRFPMMSPNQLADMYVTPVVTGGRYKDFFHEQMSIAMKYHHNQSQPQLKSQLSFIPRLYTTEIWSSSLVIENFRHLPIYGVRTLVFNTPSSLAQWEWKEQHNGHTDSAHDMFEWVMDVYPKGVWFKKSYCIRWEGTLEVPEWVCKTVRLSLSPVRKMPRKKVLIGILISGKSDGIEYVNTVIQKEFSFTKIEKLLNIDDLIPYDDLNENKNNVNSVSNCNINSNNSTKSPYLVGADNDTLKVQIVITPLTSG